ncbi:MAG: transcription termination/antitermination protein NusA [Bacteroidia bacterium]|nr:transcription termination/antitermination protein NusA [Bacteroidia bacterium]
MTTPQILTVRGLVDSFSEFKEFKNIDRATLMRVLEEVFRNMLKKRYGDDTNFDIIINTDQGDLEIYRNRLIVDEGEVEDENLQISITDARKIEPDYEIGEEAIDQVPMDFFGRRNILAARQTLMTKVLELEKDELFRKYSDRIGEIVTGEVYQIWKKEIMVLDDEGNELLLPKNEMIPADFYKKGETLKAIVHEVSMINGSPKIILSRTSPVFLEKLMELEVPEILDGLITIKKIVREPGERAKIAVESYDDRIDPVGACVGMKGSRIHGIVRELRNENIDVINFTTNISLFIQRALNPAKISSITLDENTKKANVFLSPDQVSLAIGKGGFNIRLASRLVGYDIEVYREDMGIDDSDIDLDEFADEIDSWIIDELKSIGLDTAKAVLDIANDELVTRTELEEETVIEIKKILQSEFE